MSKNAEIERLEAELRELNRQRDDWVQDALKQNRLAIAAGNVSATIICYAAHGSFPEGEAIERHQQRLKIRVAEKKG